jgi:hypothetical protein
MATTTTNACGGAEAHASAPPYYLANPRAQGTLDIRVQTMLFAWAFGALLEGLVGSIPR